ncbi:MAG: ABC transporter permease subunit, partial [Candidatus Rokuibacteriota bacterium]
MRPSLVATVFGKEWREIGSNRLLLAAVAAPAVIFAAIPIAIVGFIEVNDLDVNQLGQIAVMLAAFPDLPPKLAAQGFIVTNFMAYFLLIPAMVPIAIASQSVIGERQARSLEPQLATPIEVSELL